MKTWIFPLGLALASTGAMAVEGMWQPSQLPGLGKQMQALGLQLDPAEMADLSDFPMNAVINFGGCTASFVSPKGLLVTNHHCGYGAIQYHSTPEDNLLEEGFLARSLAEEKMPVPGYKIWITESMTDVTDQVVGDLAPSLAGQPYYEAIQRNRKALVAECEQEENVRCKVSNFHHGAQYVLIKEQELRDVRLVYTPSLSVGKYGGDIDNWMWPRHTGDFAFFRAYVGPDGKPADYSEDNVPYQPKRFLSVSAGGLSDGDFLMVAGYPGRTDRYRTAEEAAIYFERYYPAARDLRNELIDVIKGASEPGSEARIKYEGTLAGLANYAKNFQSMVESYDKTELAKHKQTQQSALWAWVEGEGDRASKYGNVKQEMDRLVEQQWAHLERDLILGYMGYNQMISSAQRLYRLAQEKQKPDLEREAGYQERDWDGIKAAMERMERRFDPAVDKAMLHHLLSRYAQLPASERDPVIDQTFGLANGLDEAKLSATLDSLYQATSLDQTEVRLAWLEKGPKAFEQSDDPFIRFAVANYPRLQKEEAEEKRLNGELLRARPQYMAAIIAYQQSQGKPVYADANSTLRLTFGTVQGYSPQDGLVAQPFTTLEGLKRKATGEVPFDASQRQLELISQRQYGGFDDKAVGSVPVNFLSDLDSTGGNSGSPTLNGKAELVGLLFDGVYESIIADWDFNTEFARSIHVDSRYMLWVMKELDGADNLLQEMDVVR
ncbi:S46 family peptidase [Ferrimonas marina]|uniref:Dipeptidyl-peptidase n=1 Tax=Ferrimonas marina TaxID=299255 RepID=A0A1M5ZFT7_9GAMM|nr:S46 family peptidase [Ferrimonas marina]SHI23080.1 Peptidase S46 [Ferrimonas marina]